MTELNSNQRLGDVGNGTGKYARSEYDTEAKLTERCMKAVARELYGKEKYFMMKMHGGGYQKSGVPDLYIIVRGMTLWIEIKLPGGDTTKLQHDKMLALQDAGAYVAVCESVEQVIATLLYALDLWGGAKSGFKRQ